MSTIWGEDQVDTHITLSWLIKSGSDIEINNFVEYGLGQEKLVLEHLKKTAVDHIESDPELIEFIEKSQASIDHEIRSEFLSVDVSSWTKKPMRILAQEADEADLYNLIYTPSSSVVHGSWNTLNRFNLVYCENPLHKYHRVPNFEEPKPHPEPMIYGMKLMERTFEAWAKYVTGQDIKSDARERMWEIIGAMYEGAEGAGRKQDPPEETK